MRALGRRTAALTIAVLLAAALASAKELTPAQAAAHVGEAATVCGVVSDASYRPDVRGEPTFLNFGGAYPNHAFTAVVWGKHRAKFTPPPESHEGKTICVSGRISSYRGKPQIVVDTPHQLSAPKAK
ncbi:MAG: DNA-binding protein [Deltaproteobacteria bacterium]|nr:DNA-binding protein [Deltaproteobacteria bacterium]